MVVVVAVIISDDSVGDDDDDNVVICEQLYCKVLGADLAVIDSADEQHYLEGFLGRMAGTSPPPSTPPSLILNL